MITEAQLKMVLDRFEHKVVHLQEHIGELERALSNLQAENQGLNKTNKEQSDQLKELRKKLERPANPFTKSLSFSKIVKDNQADAADHTELKQKLDEYIREIEQLIAYLSTLS